MSIIKTRQRLVDVARELFARKGLEATTMNDIAVASQKGRRTLYTYFRSKEEIYSAVIESELERLSEMLERVANEQIPAEQKIFAMVYAHLNQIKETVARNGSLRAEFFRNIWLVEKVRRAFDMEEITLIRRVLTEGNAAGVFHVESVNLMADIIHYAIKGCEVAYIYDRMGEGLTPEEAEVIVQDTIRRMLGMNEKA